MIQEELIIEMQTGKLPRGEGAMIMENDRQLQGLYELR